MLMNDLYGEIAEDFITEEGLIDEEGLRQWFKGGGWRQAGGKYDGKPCARQPGQKTTPKCVSRKKYRSMTKKQRDSAGRRKRRKDPNQTKKRGAAKPTYVKTDPQKGGRKKKKKSKKNEELYMTFEQMIKDELEKVLNEEGTAPTAVGLPNDIGTPEKLLAGLRALDIKKTDYNQANVIVNFINKSLMKNPSENVANALRDYKEKIADHHKFRKQARRNQKRTQPQKPTLGSERDYLRNPFGIVAEEAIKEELKAVLDEKRKKKKKKKKKGGKKDACYHKVKSRYKVWPSAYASGALVKCRKVGAKNWGNSKKESVQAMVEDELVQVLLEKKKDKTLKSKVISALRKEGGAAGMDALKKHTGASAKEISKVVDSSANIKVHKDGDIILMDSLDESHSKEHEQELKKIAKELRGASKMHAGQADRIDKILDETDDEELKEEEDKEKDDKKKKSKKKKIDLHGFKSEKETADFVKKNPSFFNEGMNCGCGNDPCKTYGKGGEKLIVVIQEELAAALEEKKKKKKKSAKDRMKCNSSRRIRKGEAGYGKKKFVVKACEGGTEKIIRYGDANMEIKKDSPKRRKSFRARHNCKNPGSKLKARYWSCKKW